MTELNIQPGVSGFNCCMCGKKIKTQIFKGTGVCGENCRKNRDNDHESWRATDRPKKTVTQTNVWDK